MDAPLSCLSQFFQGFDEPLREAAPQLEVSGARARARALGGRGAQGASRGSGSSTSDATCHSFVGLFARLGRLSIN